jgi:hypothetical protein
MLDDFLAQNTYRNSLNVKHNREFGLVLENFVSKALHLRLLMGKALENIYP